jgi:hypothetical protein
LEFPKEIYYFAATEFMTFCSEKNKNAVDLGFGLVTFAVCRMVKKRLGNRTLLIELSKRSYIRRLKFHSLPLHPNISDMTIQWQYSCSEEHWHISHTRRMRTGKVDGNSEDTEEPALEMVKVSHSQFGFLFDIYSLMIEDSNRDETAL